MIKKVINILGLLLFLVIGGCSTASTADEYLSHEEIVGVIREDMILLHEHLNSLVSSPEAQVVVDKFFLMDIRWSIYLVSNEEGNQIETVLQTFEGPASNIKYEQIIQATYHKIIIGLEDCYYCIVPVATWYLYPDGRIIPLDQAIEIEQQLKS